MFNTEFDVAGCIVCDCYLWERLSNSIYRSLYSSSFSSVLSLFVI